MFGVFGVSGLDYIFNFQCIIDYGVLGGEASPEEEKEEEYQLPQVQLPQYQLPHVQQPVNL